jgi:hypothetical protein
MPNIEYKSPVDTPPTLAVFDKLIGYARIYAAQEKVKISDMTATIICAAPPKKLFRILEDEFDYKILQKDDGIYYIVQKWVAVEKTLTIQVAVQTSDLLLQALDKRALDTAKRRPPHKAALSQQTINHNPLQTNIHNTTSTTVSHSAAENSPGPTSPGRPAGECCSS